MYDDELKCTYLGYFHDADLCKDRCINNLVIAILDKLLVVSKCMNINTRITLANNKHACTYICSSQQLTSVMMKAIPCHTDNS